MRVGVNFLFHSRALIHIYISCKHFFVGLDWINITFWLIHVDLFLCVAIQKRQPHVERRNDVAIFSSKSYSNSKCFSFCDWGKRFVLAKHRQLWTPFSYQAYFPTSFNTFVPQFQLENEFALHCLSGRSARIHVFFDFSASISVLTASSHSDATLQDKAS